MLLRSLTITPDAPFATVNNVTKTGLHDLQQIVGGYIEAVSTSDSDWHAYVNEEGLMKRLPFNRKASALATGLGWTGGPLLGTVVFLGDGPAGEEASLPEAVFEVAEMLGLLPFDDEDDEDDEDPTPCCSDPGCGGSPCTFPGYAANH